MSKDATLRFESGGAMWELHYRDSDHSYWLQSPVGKRQRVVSVSTLSRVCYSDAGGLMHWSANEAKAGRDWTASRDLAAACGTAAHDQLEALATTGKPLDLKDQPERVRGALQAVAKWWFAHKPQFVASEVMVASPTLRYAGRFDFLATIDGELCLGDLKSDDGKTWEHFRRYKAAAAFAQLAGYAIAFRECYPDSPQPMARCILRVGADGEFNWERDYALEDSEIAFINKVNVYRQDQTWSKAYESLRKAVLAA